MSDHDPLEQLFDPQEDPRVAAAFRSIERELGTPPDEVTVQRHRRAVRAELAPVGPRQIVGRAVVAGLASAAAVAGLAVAGLLPATAQDIVADAAALVGLELPRPHQDASPGEPGLEVPGNPETGGDGADAPGDADAARNDAAPARPVPPATGPDVDTPGASDHDEGPGATPPAHGEPPAGVPSGSPTSTPPATPPGQHRPPAEPTTPAPRGTPAPESTAPQGNPNGKGTPAPQSTAPQGNPNSRGTPAPQSTAPQGNPNGRGTPAPQSTAPQGNPNSQGSPAPESTASLGGAG